MTGPGGRLAAYGVLLVAVLGGGAALGAGVGPIDVGAGSNGGDHDVGHGDPGNEPAPPGEPAALPAGGLLVSQDGYTMRMATRVLDPGRPQPFSFLIEGPDGSPVHDYDLRHERELHLVVVSADLARFAHVHPSRDALGVWTTELPAVPPGSYRAFADFDPRAGHPLTLGVDVTVPGPAGAPVELVERREVEVDGYRATLNGELTPGTSSEMGITVRRGGNVITTDPYLGAAGHLVVIRDGDLAYLHVHPVDGVPPGPVRFGVEVPSIGSYALFFDFSLQGAVRTASFVTTAGGR